MPPKKKGSGPLVYGGDITRFFQPAQQRAGVAPRGNPRAALDMTRASASVAPMTCAVLDVRNRVAQVIEACGRPLQPPTSLTSAATPGRPRTESASGGDLQSPSVDALTQPMQQLMAENVTKAARKAADDAALKEELAAARMAAQASEVLDASMNEEQHKAATARGSEPLMIVAGAGTGKTTTLLQRVRYFVLKEKVHPAHVLLISFTVKAATEAKERLKQLNLPGADRIRVGTFHSICYSVITENYRRLGFERAPTVLSETSDVRRIIARAMVRANIERHKGTLCGWLQIPMTNTDWQGVVDEIQKQHPEEFARSAKEAADWYVKHAANKPKNKRKTAASKGKAAAASGDQDRGEKRKGAAAGGWKTGSGSPVKQRRLVNGAAPVETGTGVSIEEEESLAEENPDELARAGDVAAMPRELQTALFVHLFVNMARFYDQSVYKALRDQWEKQKKKDKGTVAGLLLAKPLAKDLKSVHQQVEELKRRGTPPDNVPIRSLQTVYKVYQQELVAQNSCDFNDLLIHVSKLFRDHPFLAKRFARRYPVVLVDEFQDTNVLQLDIILAISPPSNSRVKAEQLSSPSSAASLTVVGDGDQSIYRFRGADPHVLYAFQQNYQHEHLRHRLEKNYRCSSAVLEVAAVTLRGNEHSRDPDERLYPTRTGPCENVTVVELENPEAEARWMCQEIKQHLCDGVDPTEVSVLFRSFSWGCTKTYVPLTRELEAAQIPYRIVREVSLLNRASVKDILAYADLVVNPENDAAFLRVYNTPRRKLGEKVEARLMAMQESSAAAGRRSSLMACARELATSGVLGPQQSQSLRRFVQLIDELRATAMVLRPPEMIDRIIHSTQYVQYMQSEADKKRKKMAEKGDRTLDEMERELQNALDGADEDGEDEDVEDDEDDEDVNAEHDLDPEDNPAECDGDGAGVDPSRANSDQALHWPYVFECTLDGPLRRLRNEAIKWCKETEPRLGLEIDNGPFEVDGESTKRGPPSLESLCLRALATPQGLGEVQDMLQRGTEGLVNVRPFEVIAAASHCGIGPLAEFQSYLRLNQSDIPSASKSNALSSAELGVTISTIHAAKGLEWKVVFVPRLNDQFLPDVRTKEQRIDPEEEQGEGEAEAAGDENGIDAAVVVNRNAMNDGDRGAPPPPSRLRLSDEEESLAEERRLAHVAATRAKDKLYMSYVRQVYGIVEGQGWGKVDLKRSCILNEVVKHCGKVIELRGIA